MFVTSVGALVWLYRRNTHLRHHPAQVLAGINFDSATPVDESYRAEFDRCDRENKFKNQTMTGFRKCSQDKNRVNALLKFSNGVIFFESKLSLDIDGSWKACNSAGATAVSRVVSCSSCFLARPYLISLRKMRCKR
jgi:hypothetical protein